MRITKSVSVKKQGRYSEEPTILLATHKESYFLGTYKGATSKLFTNHTRQEYLWEEGPPNVRPWQYMRTPCKKQSGAPQARDINEGAKMYLKINLRIGTCILIL